MSEEIDMTLACKPRLSKLAVLALFSSLPCITTMGIVFDLLPLRHAFMLPHLWLVDTFVVILCGSKISRSAGLTGAVVFPGLISLTVPPAIVLGFAAVIHIDRSHGRLNGISLGMAAIGIATICSLLASPLVMRDLKRVHEAVKLISIEGGEKQCGERILAVGAALKRYASSHEGHFPNGNTWCDTLIQGHYLDDQEQLLWLANRRRWPCAINPDCGPDSPGETVLLFETDPAWNRHSGPELLRATRHGDGRIHVFLKNHRLEKAKCDSLEELVWK